MSEDSIEKKRKKRRRSARFYISTAHPLPTPEQIAALADQFPSDADDDGDGQAAAVMRPGTRKRRISQADRKRLAREGNAVVNPDGHVSYPIETVEDLHNAATLARTGHGDVEAARKLIARRARELNVPNPLESASKALFNHQNPYDGSDYADARTSAPITEGHASPSSGDHGVGQGRGSHIAAHHPDLRQSNTSFDQVLARLQTVNGDNQNGDRDITYRPGEVALRMFDAAGAAGHYHGMGPVDPNPLRPDYHQARGSATPPNGSHGSGSPASRPPMAAKSNSELRAEFKRMLFPGSGGGR